MGPSQACPPRFKEGHPSLKKHKSVPPRYPRLREQASLCTASWYCVTFTFSSVKWACESHSHLVGLMQVRIQTHPAPLAQAWHVARLPFCVSLRAYLCTLRAGPRRLGSHRQRGHAGPGHRSLRHSRVQAASSHNSRPTSRCKQGHQTPPAAGSQQPPLGSGRGHDQPISQTLHGGWKAG